MKIKWVSTAFFILLLLSACNIPTGESPSATIADPSPSVTSTDEAASPTAQIVSPTVEEASATPEPSNTNAAPTATQPSPTSPPAATQPAGAAGRYGVILVEEGDVLNIRDQAGVNGEIVGEFPPGTDDVITTGESARVSGDLWLEVENLSGGTGWVNAWYLTEYVPSDEFCSDEEVVALLEDFKRALNDEDGDLLASLVSPVHGLEVYYWAYGPSANYTPAEASWVFESTFDVNWGSGPSGIDDIGTFSEYPLPELLEVVNDEDYEMQCNDLSTVNLYVQPWPLIYEPLNFYALHKPASPDVELDWMTWLAGVAYIQGEPYLMALIRFVWEP